MNLSAADTVAGVMLASMILYTLLGGADYGAGVWDLLARGPRARAQRDLIAQAIGPVWEANHVWLIVLVVLLFTGFPAAFSAIMTTLHVPLTLMLVGVVLRGSAFTFRSYDMSESGPRRWNKVFSIPSVVTPVLLGIVFGAVASGQVGQVDRSSGYALLFDAWIAPFPFAVGAWALALFAYIAAVYLTLETADPALREDFRRRAIGSAIAVGALAWLVYFLARTEAPLVAQGLNRSGWGFPVRVATGSFAIASIAALVSRRYQLARIATVLQVTLILTACGLSLHPYLVPPDITIQNAAAPVLILRLLLAALAAGSMILLPSLYYLFRIFKSHTFRASPSPGVPAS